MTRQKVSLLKELPLIIWLVLVWGALWQDFSLGNLVFGALIALVVARVFYLPPVELSGRFNVLRAIVYAAIFLKDVVAGSFTVFYLALVRGPNVRNAVVAVPLRSHSDLMITATGHVLSLVPGSLVVEVDRATPMLYIHALNVSTPGQLEKVRAGVRATEAHLIKIMGSKEELAALAAEKSGTGAAR